MKYKVSINLYIFGSINPSIRMEPSKNWNGNSASPFASLGASQHSKDERVKHDFYATDPRAVEMLIELENDLNNVLEPCCGAGHISKVLLNSGIAVTSTDLVNHGYGRTGIDFLQYERWTGDIVTNPPYKHAREFVEHGLKIMQRGSKMVMFLKLTFLEGKGRKDLFRKYPPKRIWVSRSRINCARNGDFEGQRISGGSAVCYCWFVWEKGFIGNPELRWFN